GLLALVLIVGFWIGDRQFPARAQTIAKATGLGHMGALRLFEA
ncbi:MAG TPA: dibenzothiophene desulfurase, partial [Rhodobacter sp.]|nr:dibenzothiophene desulfurase [Rhodobacter sp.]